MNIVSFGGGTNSAALLIGLYKHKIPIEMCIRDRSFSAKREITNAFLITADDIIICDPEAEYYPLVERLKGQVLSLIHIFASCVSGR